MKRYTGAFIYSAIPRYIVSLSNRRHKRRCKTPYIIAASLIIFKRHDALSNKHSFHRVSSVVHITDIFWVNFYYWCNHSTNRKCVRGSSTCCINHDSNAIFYTHYKWLSSIRTNASNRSVSNDRHIINNYTGTFVYSAIP